jgi:geranylgeranyl pyrophosphate synthase
MTNRAKTTKRTTMASFDLEAYFEDRRARVDAALDANLPTLGNEDPGRLIEGMRYAVLQGGKRMRPLLVIAACEAAGGRVEQALPACCALELVHAYSLVHDDLPAMDNDVERRGKPTVHVAFGEANAILIGDALITLAFELLARGTEGVSRAAMADAVAILARHAGIAGMVGGQAEDLALGQDIGDLAVLERVHALKTGGLYAAAAALGGLCAGADSDRVTQLERLGLAFGIAFQHADDILDDDQERLRAQALERVDELVRECHRISEGFKDPAAPLRAVVDWVHARTRRAAAGDKAD